MTKKIFKPHFSIDDSGKLDLGYKTISYFPLLKQSQGFCAVEKFYVQSLSQKYHIHISMTVLQNLSHLHKLYILRYVGQESYIS